MGLFEKAIKYATEKHSGSYRKGTRIPYITHPIEAAAIVATLFDDEMTDKQKDEVLAAAVLHDTIEDTDATAKNIKEKFGESVLCLVLADSENKRRERPAEDTWKERKQETIDYAKNKATKYEKMVVLGDKLSNIRAIARDYETLHNKVWKRFNRQDPEEHAWYYSSFIEVLRPEFKDTAAYKEYVILVKRVFENTKAFSEIYERCKVGDTIRTSQKDFLKRLSKQLEKRKVICWLGYGKEVPILRFAYTKWDRNIVFNVLYPDKDEKNEVGIIITGIGSCSNRDRRRITEYFNSLNQYSKFVFFINDDGEIRALYRYCIDSSVSAAVNHIEGFLGSGVQLLESVMPRLLEMMTV